MSRNITRRTFLAGGAAAALTALTGCSATTPFVGKREESTRTVDAAGLDSLAVDTQIGDIRVVGTDRDDVRIRAVKQASSVRADISKLSLDVQRSDGTLRLQSDWTGSTGLFAGRPSLDLDVELPRSLAVDGVRTRVGDADVTDVAGDLEVRSDTGDVSASGVAGAVTAISQTGDVTVRSPEVLAEATAQTGDVDVEIPAIDGETTVETQTGDVTARVAADLDAALVAQTQTGDVRVDGLTLRESESDDGFSGDSIRGTLGDGGPRLTLEAQTGDVTVRPIE
ncbi:DUF4097 family beta strand repeat-containing protein [Haloarcula litorea]|uniref:DUF4097 family beta strand repeat-containing protein n=1 Tax=Haloarcula litorea TaxID=3032579 RepID=UPI0023E805DF|nr:DUF4097 family beta strand repeat-containing protein [Halomicroarcula sp. GDY20]